MPEIETGTAIPRLIHQMYPVQDLPEALARNLKHIVETHPDWEHRLYDNETALAYVEAHYGPDIARILARIRPEYGVARSDLFRYLVIYREGGVYLDIKSRPEVPLDQILAGGDTFITSHWGEDEFRAFGRHRELKHVPAGELQQWHVIAVAGHSILRDVILHVLENVTSYSPWRLGVGKPGVLRTTGPIAYTRAVMASAQKGVRIAQSHRELGLRYSVVDDHTVFFTNHYSSLRTPLIAPELFAGKVSTLAYCTLRGLWLTVQPTVRALRRRREKAASTSGATQVSAR